MKSASDNKKRIDERLLILPVIASVVLLFALFAVLALGPAASPADQKITLMIYMTGSDLEAGAGAATQDLKEIAENRPESPDVNILIYTGGSSRWYTDGIAPDSNCILLLTADGYVTVGTMEIESMGEPDSLARFLEYSYENYPADEYDLIMWDHGNGPVMGYGIDRVYGDDTLTLTEMREALDRSPFGKDNRLGFIGFDACLMASAELACIAGDYADYLVSSQETEPCFGWDYSFLTGIQGKTSREKAVSIVDAYYEYGAGYIETKENFDCDLTLSVIDLSGAEQLRESVNTLFAAAADDVSGDFNELAYARVHTRAFGRASTGSEYDLVDLYETAAQLAEKYPEETEGLMRSIDSVVVYNRTNTGKSCGMSIYYPFFNKDNYEEAWMEEYRSLDVFTGYTSYLERYGQIWAGTNYNRYYDENLQPVLGDEPATYTLKLNEEQQETYAESRYYVLRRIGDEKYECLYCSSNVTEENGELTAHFDNRIIYVFTPYGDYGIPPIKERDTIDGHTNYAVIGSLLYSPVYGSRMCDIQLKTDENSDKVDIVGVYKVQDEYEKSLNTGKRENIELLEYSDYQYINPIPFFLTRDENGIIKSIRDWETDKTTFYRGGSFLTGDVSFAYRPLFDDGYEYFLIFDIMDTLGNYHSSELMPVMLDKAPDTVAEVDEYDWDTGDGISVYQGDNVEVSIKSHPDLETGLSDYTFIMDNQTDAEIKVKIENIVINDEYHLNNGVYLDYGSESGSIKGINELRAFSLVDKVRSVEFDLKVIDDTNHKTVFFKKIKISVSDNITYDPDFYDRIADEQTVEIGDGIEVLVYGMGMTIEKYGGLYYEMLVNNSSDVPHNIEFTGFNINGISFRANYVYMSLPQNNSGYICGEVSDVFGLGNPIYDDYPDDLPHIDDIYSVEMVFVIDGEYVFANVEVYGGSNGESMKPEGVIIYEDDSFIIWKDCEFSHENLSASYCCCGIWVLNKTDELRYLEFRDENDKLLTCFYVIPLSLDYEVIKDQSQDPGSVYIKDHQDYTSSVFELWEND